MFNKKFRLEPTEKQKIGQLGEDIASTYLIRNGYSIIGRNFLKKWGEIDIIAKLGKKLHFIEVKAVSRNLEDINDDLPNNIQNKVDSYHAEDNMHPWKLQRLGRTVQSYLLERDVPDSMDWQFDVITVHIDANKGLSKVFVLPDIVL
jgi:putative endonuclease